MKRYRGIYKDKNGKYFYQTELGLDPITGKRISKKGRTNKIGKPFESAKEAYDEMIEVKAEFNRLYSHDNYNMTFKQYMNNIYLVAYKQKVQAITYRTALTHHKEFVKRFGKTKLREISPRDCEMYRLNIMDKYSANYACNLWSRFKACLGYAERLGYISSFPCRALENPKGKHPDTKFWRKEEFLKVMDTFDMTDYHERLGHALTWCGFVWGARVGEILALKWRDISFAEKMIHIHTTLERGEDGLVAKEGTKTEDSNRYVECDDVTLEILKQWRKMQITSRREDYVFSLFGTPTDKSTFTRMLKRHAKVAGVPEITGKGLRHSNNTYLRRELGKSSELVSMPRTKKYSEVTKAFGEIRLLLNQMIDGVYPKSQQLLVSRCVRDIMVGDIVNVGTGWFTDDSLSATDGFHELLVMNLKMLKDL